MRFQNRSIVRAGSCTVLLVMGLVFWECYQKKGTEVARRPIEQVLKEQTEHLMSISGVVGTAIGTCDKVPCIQVLVQKKTREIERRIPQTLDGWKVDVQEVGTAKAL